MITAPDTTPKTSDRMPAIYWTGLALMLLTDLAVAIALGRSASTAGGVIVIFCSLYALGLTVGMLRVRPREAPDARYRWTLSLVAAQLFVYAVFWGGMALPRASGPVGSWNDWTTGSLFVAFFVVGPLAAILLPLAGRRTHVLAVTELVAPLTLLLLLAS